MHFEILVEDSSGKKALDILMPKILGDLHTFKVHPYRGIGRIPKNLTSGTEADKRILLDQLPSTTWHNCRMSYMFSKGRCDFLIAPSVNVQFKWAYKGAP